MTGLKNRAVAGRMTKMGSHEWCRVERESLDGCPGRTRSAGEGRTGVAPTCRHGAPERPASRSQEDGFLWFGPPRLCHFVVVVQEADTGSSVATAMGIQC